MLWKFQKPKAYPEKQSLAGHEDLLAKIKTFVEAHPEVKFSAYTGSSLYLCDNIIEATGMNEISAVEMGQEIYNPPNKRMLWAFEKAIWRKKGKKRINALKALDGGCRWSKGVYANKCPVLRLPFKAILPRL